MAAAEGGGSSVRPRPKSNRSVPQSGLLQPNQEQKSDDLLITFLDNTENEQRLSNMGAAYDPLADCTEEDDNFSDLGIPSSLSIRSQRSYGLVEHEESQGASSAAAAAIAPPPIPIKTKTQSSRSLRIRGLEPSRPEHDLPASVELSSAARRFSTPQRNNHTNGISMEESPYLVAAASQRRASEGARSAGVSSNALPAVNRSLSSPMAGPLRGLRSSNLPEPVVDPNSPLPSYDFSCGGSSEAMQKMFEAMGMDRDDSVFGWNTPPPDGFDAPPPYMPKNLFDRASQKSLKQSQVEILMKEMSHSGGVKVMLRRVDCHHTIALADVNNGVWIAGWMQKARPFLHNAFHVGDKLVCINGQVIENARMAQKLIKHCQENDKLTFIIKRVPHAKIFAIRRSENGESLGIRREGGSGEIMDVDQYGLAARHGLTAKAPSKDGTNLCNWFLTEINSRPVNLFYKGDEIERRLNAVGKDISIMVQPVEFVAALKKELKNTYKNYKDFVVE